MVPAAAGGIDGTWKADLATVQIDSKPDELLLKDGKFSCATCTPAYTVAADGAFHAVTRPYADSMAVKIVDEHTVTTSAKKGGAAVGENKYSVSPDGKTLTVDFTDSSVPNATPVKGSLTETRSADAPGGAHAISGSWKIDKYNNISDEGLTVTFKLNGDTMHMSTPSGVSYDAKVGGPDVAIKGDTAGTTAAVTKSGDSYVETDKRDGKVISVTTMTVGADSKLHVLNEDKRNGSTVKYDANKA
ncbi:MAG: hypothetical protein ABIP41_02255 [Croceibacterium sp.]